METAAVQLTGDTRGCCLCLSEYCGYRSIQRAKPSFARVRPRLIRIGDEYRGKRHPFVARYFPCGDWTSVHKFLRFSDLHPSGPPEQVHAGADWKLSTCLSGTIDVPLQTMEFFRCPVTDNKSGKSVRHICH